jgi:hypothetical protein
MLFHLHAFHIFVCWYCDLMRALMDELGFRGRQNIYAGKLAAD